MEKKESVRLVIWDLDETLWRGTLTEGGIKEHVDQNYAIIRELAHRGIISSICSKNDFAVVREILVERGIWDYFVFPSIDWSPKGGRIRQIVDSFQLRAETALFIDDNPSNLAEAAAVVSGIQTLSEECIGELLLNPAFVGKSDVELSRLKQYKLLEKRFKDQRLHSGDNIDFLRGSSIKVSFEYDVESHIDRAVELINRTNQLNFTKVRLPEDIASARMELLKSLGSWTRQAALIRVQDNYGDYGFVGIYVTSGERHTGRISALEHFCFSCRTIGMGVEKWVYDRLGRPPIKIFGDVVIDLTKHGEVDWINMTPKSTDIKNALKATASSVRIRGGCELDALVHYSRISAKSVVQETNIVKRHFFLRKNASCHIVAPILPSSELYSDDLFKLGLDVHDFETCLFESIEDGGISIFSAWADPWVPHYQSKDGSIVACNLTYGQRFNLCNLTDRELEVKFGPGGFNEKYKAEIFDYISKIREFSYVGRLPADIVANNHNVIFAKIPKNGDAFFILPSEYIRNGEIGVRQLAVDYNSIIESLAQLHPHITLLRIDDFIKNDDERLEGFDHFERMVYYRLYEGIAKKCQASSRAKS